MRNLSIPVLLVLLQFHLCSSPLLCKQTNKAVQPASKKQSNRKISDEELLEACQKYSFEQAKAATAEESLSGLKEVNLIVENLPTEFLSILDPQSLKTAIEMRCRSCGLKVAENKLLPPNLYVNINAIGAAQLSYSIDVRLQELALMERNRKMLVITDTYSNGCLHVVGANKANRNSIKQDVIDMIDEFLNSWMKANGR